MITMKAVSPVHVGTGIEYSPIEFVLRRDKGGKDWLWRLDQSRFLSALSESKQNQFIAEVDEEGFDLNRFTQGMDLFPLRPLYCEGLLRNRPHPCHKGVHQDG